MSLTSLVRRGFEDSIPSLIRQGFSTPGAAPVLVGGVGSLRLVQNRPAANFEIEAVFSGSGMSYAISPALHANGSFNTATGVLTWNPLTVGAFGPYTVRATNSSGFVDSDAFTMTVQATAPPNSAFNLGLEYRLRIGF
jgi:hypothetical protein